MAEPHQTKTNGNGRRHSKAFRDLIALLAVTLTVFLLSYFFDAFILIVHYIQKHPDKIVYVDEVLTGFLTLSIGLALFSWRRWRELKKETALRLKQQEERLHCATTQAEVERIISKQLRYDMDQLKEDVRQILTLLSRQKR